VSVGLTTRWLGILRISQRDDDQKTLTSRERWDNSPGGQHETVSLKQFISVYPVIFGALVGLFIFLTILASAIWAPWIGEDIGRHKFLFEAIWGSFALFAVSLNRFWPLRHRSDFRTMLCTIFSLHFLGLYLYAAYVHDLTLGQLTVLMLAELLVIFSVVPWTTKHLSRVGRRGRVA
jgi:hypothetical protein